MRINNSKPLQTENSAKPIQSSADLASEIKAVSTADSFTSVTRPAQDGVLIDLVNSQKQAETVAKAKLEELSLNYLAKSTELNSKMDDKK